MYLGFLTRHPLLHWPTIHRGLRGKYDIAQCMLWYIRYLQKAMERRELSLEDTLGTSIRRERQRLIKAQADREEHDLAEMRRQLIPIAICEAHKAGHFDTVRERFLALPAAIAPQLEGKTRAFIKSELDKDIREALTAVAVGAIYSITPGAD